jgi:diaminohydroxyphosphoribosylaminopyrimidine deaminase/5-amino-6-(5-phosphoribosylamino)uracil reductase
VAERVLPDVYTDEFRERTIVVTTEHGGLGYVRKLRDQGVNVWVLRSPTQQVPFGEFRTRCAEEKITGVYFEGGPVLLSEALAARALDYLFAYRAPLLFADEKARSIFSGLRTEKVGASVRLAEVRREQFGDDDLVRGRIVYPEKLQIDETVIGVR